MILGDPAARLFSHSNKVVSLIYVKIPLALHSSVTAKLSFSSFALRSVSDMARSASYVPSDRTVDRARLEMAKAYVRSDDARSACKEGSDSRGEL